MKRLPAFYSILVLIGPLLVIAALMAGPFGCGGGGGGGPTATPLTGSVEIGFIDSPSSAFQAISVNIVSVRLNPAATPVPDSDPNWVTITAPSGSGPGELSVNLLDFQNNAVVFNTGQVTAQTYHQVEVVFDSSQPAMVIPSCIAGASPVQEGCITANATFTGSTSLMTSATVIVPPNGLQTLLIDINPGNPVSPTSPGGNYLLNPSITVVPSTGYLVPVSGTVSGLSLGSVVTINAELTGTNSVVATAPVASDGAYTIDLPAAANGGTIYDLFVSGSTTFAVFQGLTVTRTGPPPTGPNFAVTTGASASITGAVIDARTKGALVGATVNLLLQQSASDDCTTSMTGCVVVSTTTSNSVGNYTFSAPLPPSGLSYFVQASMTGTQTVTEQVNFSSSGITCTGSPNPSNCSFSMPNTLLSGTVTVDPPPGPGSNIVVTVMAEQTGTGNLVGLTQVTVPASGTAPFSMEVPPAPPGTNVDLIASAQDAYLGVGTPFSGHSIAVMSNVDPSSSGPINLTVNCLGHGTIAGVANSSDAGTHVVLFQSGVQLMDSTVGTTVPVPSSSATPAYPNQYSFCVPPNTYTLERTEQSGPTGSPSPVATQVVVVPPPAPLPSPTATSTACPLCENAGGQCPGNCSATQASPF